MNRKCSPAELFGKPPSFEEKKSRRKRKLNEEFGEMDIWKAKKIVMTSDSYLLGIEAKKVKN